MFGELHSLQMCSDLCLSVFWQLKVDKLKLIEVCGTSETEFASVSNRLLSQFICLYGSCPFWNALVDYNCRFLPQWRICVMMFLELQKKRKILGS